MIGIYDHVQLFHRGDGRRVELSAVGDITAPPALVHSMLLSHTNPRVIASLAEGWAAGVCPPTDKFTLSARWSTQQSFGLSFKLRDDRGAITRPTNWITARSRRGSPPHPPRCREFRLIDAFLTSGSAENLTTRFRSREKPLGTQVAPGRQRDGGHHGNAADFDSDALDDFVRRPDQDRRARRRRGLSQQG
jgi:hypothetical protein